VRPAATALAPRMQMLVRVAAYQARLLPRGSTEAIGLIRERIDACEAAGVEILCCPEAVLGGLADYAESPADLAIDVEGGRLEAVLAPLASDTVTSIVGFTEISGAGRLYSSAAVHRRGAVAGVYRDRKSTRLNSSHTMQSRMPSSA